MLTDVKTLTIAFSIDNGYVNQLKVVLRSLFKHKKSATSYAIYVLAYQLSDANFSALEAVVKQFDQEKSSTLTHLKITTEDEESLPLFKNVAFGDNWGRETLYRLLLPKYLPSHIERVLYLDADILVQDDLSELDHVDLTQKALAAVLDPIHFDVYGYVALHNYRLAKLEGLSDQQYSRLFAHHGYINAGVLLLNISYWQEHQLDKQMIELLNRIYQEGESFLPYPKEYFPVTQIKEKKWQHKFFPDQDVINYLLLRRNLGEIAYLPTHYNISTAIFAKNAKLKAEEWDVLLWLNQLHCNMPVRGADFTEIGEDPKIWHFISDNKPWVNEKHPFATLYQQYARDVDWHITYTSTKSHPLLRIIKLLLPYGLIRWIQKKEFSE